MPHERGVTDLQIPLRRLPFAADGQAALLRHAEGLRDLAPVHPRLDFGPDGSVRGVVMPGDAGYGEAGPPQP